MENELERLKAFVLCECDHFAAFASFDEMGNLARFVKRAYIDLGDIVPELEEFAKEVGYFNAKDGIQKTG